MLSLIIVLKHELKHEFSSKFWLLLKVLVERLRIEIKERMDGWMDEGEFMAA